MTAPRLRLAGALALLALGGCSAIDTRYLSLTIERPDRREEQVRFLVKGGSGTAVEALIDGQPMGRFTTGREAVIDLHPIAEGFHTLRIEGRGARPAGPVEARFEIFRGFPELVATSPAAGPVPVDGPLEIALTFSEPLDPTSVTPETCWLAHTPSSLTSLGASVSLSADGRTVRLRLEAGVLGFEAIAVQARVRDLGGYPAFVGAYGWIGAAISVGFREPLSASPRVRGTLQLTPVDTAVTGPGPAAAELLAGDVVIATRDGGSWNPVRWDTTQVPDGDYPLSVRAPGWSTSVGDGLVLRIDNTPPRLTCRPQRSPAGFAESGECVTITTSEEVVHFNVALVPLGTVIPEEAWTSGAGQHLACPAGSPPPPPYVEHLDLSSATDLAGNPVVAEGCTLTVPTWLAPWGEAAISIGGAPPRASALVLATTGVNLFVSTRQLVLAWVAAAPETDAGRLMTASSPSGLDWTAPVPLSTAGAIASKPAVGTTMDSALPADLVARLAWVERTGGGPGQVRSALRTASGWLDDVAGPLNRDPSRDADDPAVATAYLISAPPAVLWSEEDGAGGRALQGRFPTSTNAGVAMALADGDPRAAAGTTVTGPAMARTNLVNSIAFLERAPGGPTLLRQARLDFFGGVPTFSPIDLALNEDPAVSALDASVAATTAAVVAWVEGGRVLARARSLLGGELPLAVLNADPSHVARSPVAFRDGDQVGVAFVEETADGDKIFVQIPEGGAWRLLPDAANAGIPGPVRGLHVASGLTNGVIVGWVDADDHLRVRLGNH